MGFLRSIFGRQPPAVIPAGGVPMGPAVARAVAAASASAPAPATAREERDGSAGGGGPRPSAEEARAAAVEEQERRRAAARAGEHPGAGVNIPAPGDAGGGDGPASFAIRDLLSFLQPALDPAGSIASLEQALNWPGGIGMIGPGPPGGGGMMRRRVQQPTAEQARQELQFNGLMLAPHQVRNVSRSAGNERRQGGRQ